MSKKARKLKNEDPPRDRFSIGNETGSQKPQAKKPPKVFDAYTRNRVLAPVHDPEIHGPSQVQQHFKDEVDINNIIAKYTQTGQITHYARGKPSYGDVPDGADFTDAMNLITEAQAEFDALPSEVRSHFQNDPRKYLDAFQPDNKEELQSLGLIAPDPVEPTPVQVQVINPDPPPSPSGD